MKKYSSKQAKRGKIAYRTPHRFHFQTARFARGNFPEIKQHQKFPKALKFPRVGRQGAKRPPETEGVWSGGRGNFKWKSKKK